MTFKDFLSNLRKPLDATFLGVFRMLFGFLMMLDIFRYLKMDLIHAGLLAPKMLFTYDGLEFVRPLPEGVMVLILPVMVVASILIMVGWWTRIAAAVFFVFNMYILLLDKSLFNNHIYFFSLVCLIFLVVDSDAAFSAKRSFSKSKMTGLVPAWHIRLLQFQVAVVYFYGGITKLTSDWLTRQEPVRSALLTAAKREGLLDTVQAPWVGHFFAVGGLIFDLVIPFMLWHKKFRWWAVPAILFFNLTNSWIFNDIGLFPFAMLSATMLFFYKEDFGFLTGTAANAKRVKKEKEKIAAVAPASVTDKFPRLKWVLLSYVIFQLLFPLRHWLLPNQVDWTGVAQRFSWRMKAQFREASQIEYTITDGTTGKKYDVDEGSYIHTTQLNILKQDARMVWQFAKFLEKEALKSNVPDPVIQAHIKVKMNQRPEQYFIDTTANLAKVEYSPFKKLDWIVPLEK